ncbi:MAG TPA: N(4)-(beta-N-acetylglucosaminyl)-L-asparaginase [Candidatus Acidoferrum sp.]|nr:N(4)-(beta-N-acetylglucosaminyl)-L-asparaginase [Candidatus Acidoferrum sp.]
MDNWTRRRFFAAAVLGGIAARTKQLFGGDITGSKPPAGANGVRATAGGTRPLIISAGNGFPHLDDGMAVLKSGGDTLDAVLAVVTKVEDDPNIDTVGYGGLPNEEGVVQLDACVMHGPTAKCGAVGSIETIKNPSLVARVVMEKTNHTFLVGPGATKFAVDEGFQQMNLLTDRSRVAWLAWKAKSSENWRPGLDSPQWKAQLSEWLDTPERLAWRARIEEVVEHPPTGTINCLAVDANGNISGTTTTSGLAWKINGRVGDSPIIGAGLFVDNEVGAAGSTGRGEENIKIAGGHTIVEMMRRGMSPTDACLEALHRVAANYKAFPERLDDFHLQFYAINKDGQHGASTLWARSKVSGKQVVYAVHDGTKATLVPCTPMFDKAGGDY